MKKAESIKKALEFFKAKVASNHKSFSDWRSFCCRLLDERHIRPLLKIPRRVLDMKPHPLLTLVAVVLFCTFMAWPYGWLILQIPNPFRFIAILTTIITLVIGTGITCTRAIETHQL